MKVLLVNTENTWRGGERQTFYTLMGLIKEGVEVSLIAKKHSALAKKSRQEGARVYQSTSNFHSLIILIMKGSKFDIIHPQSGKSHTHCVLSKFFHRTPIIYSRRVDFFPKGLFTKIKYKYTDSVVSISKAVSEILSKAGMCSNSPIISSAVSYRKPDFSRCQKIKESLGIKSDMKIIGLVAALEPHKDPYTAIRAIYQLYGCRDDFVVLHFGNGSIFEKAADLLQELNLAKKYFLMGHQNNVEDFFSIMDVFLMTSSEEGLGSSIMDAFSNNVAVVSTNAGGLKELVDSRGYLCDVGDVMCLSKCLNEALERNKQSKKYILAAKKFCDDELSINIMVNKYISIYRELIDE